MVIKNGIKKIAELKMKIEQQLNKDINNKFCMSLNYKKLPEIEDEFETDIQKINDPEFTLKTIIFLTAILFISLIIIYLFGFSN